MWYKVTANVALKVIKNALPSCILLKKELSAPHLFFARYQNDPNGPGDLAVQFYSLLNKKAIIATFVKVFGKYLLKEVELIPRKREKGSHIHAAAFEYAVELYESRANLSQFLDVQHWLYNMLGFDYIDEASFNGQAAAAALIQIAGFDKCQLRYDRKKS
jgi:hypothetical protein